MNSSKQNLYRIVVLETFRLALEDELNPFHPYALKIQNKLDGIDSLEMLKYHLSVAGVDERICSFPLRQPYDDKEHGLEYLVQAIGFIVFNNVTEASEILVDLMNKDKFHINWKDKDQVSGLFYIYHDTLLNHPKYDDSLCESIGYAVLRHFKEIDTEIAKEFMKLFKAFGRIGLEGTDLFFRMRSWLETGIDEDPFDFLHQLPPSQS